MLNGLRGETGETFLCCLLEWGNYPHSKTQISCKRQPFVSDDGQSFLNLAKTRVQPQPLSPAVMSRHVKTLANTKAKQVLLTREDGNSVVTFSALLSANVSPLRRLHYLSQKFSTPHFPPSFFFFFFLLNWPSIETTNPFLAFNCIEF